jgi:MFS family permease
MPTAGQRLAKPMKTSVYLVLAAALLYGTSLGQLTLLAPVLKETGLAPSAIALVLSAMTLATIPGKICSGWLMDRIGVVRSLWVGAIATVASIGGLVCAIAVVPFAAILPFAVAMRCLQGASYGVFNSAGMCAVKNYAPADQQLYVVGLFTAMFMACNLWASALGELTLHYFGATVFLLLAALPVLLALGLTMRVRDVAVPAPGNSGGYLALLRDRRLWLPQAVAFNSGTVYGFAMSFLPVLLIDAHVPVTAFFTAFAAALLVNRLVLLKYLQGLAPPILAAYGLAGFAATLGALLLPPSVTNVALAGALMGLGSVLHPSAVEWSTRYFPKAQSGRPVALINTVLSIGIIGATQLMGAMLSWGRGWMVGLLFLPLAPTLAGIGIHLWREQAEADQARAGHRVG